MFRAGIVSRLTVAIILDAIIDVLYSFTKKLLLEKLNVRYEHDRYLIYRYMLTPITDFLMTLQIFVLVGNLNDLEKTDMV